MMLIQQRNVSPVFLLKALVSFCAVVLRMALRDISTLQTDIFLF